MDTLKSLLAKFSQPSSWAGLGAILALFGFNVSGDTLGTIIQIGAGACGLIAIIVNEKAGAQKSAILPPLVALGLAGMLTACSTGAGTPQTTVAGVQNTQQAIQTAIGTACQDVNAASALAAPFAGVPQVAGVLTFATASCGTADAIAALVTKAVTDPTTIAWAENLASQLKAAVAAISALKSAV